jgi:hypothetical protein
LGEQSLKVTSMAAREPGALFHGELRYRSIVTASLPT